MEKIIADFGVQPVYLAAQMVNFLILLVILNKFLFKPILKVLEERKRTVSETLSNADQIKSKLSQAEQDVEAKLSDASRQAKMILENASNQAQKIIEDARQKAQQDADEIIHNGKEAVDAERQAMKKEVQKEFAGLLVLGVEKVSGKVLKEVDHGKIVEQTIKSLDINA